jgi:hypothetical protein
MTTRRAGLARWMGRALESVVSATGEG